MNKKSGVSFFLVVIALIVGRRLFQHFDFETFTFEKPLLDIIYLITFIVMVVFMVKVFRDRKKQD